MKILVITKLKDTYVMLPTEMKIKLMEGAGAFIAKYKQAGVCKEIYSIASKQGSVSIWDIESSDKAAELLRENPLAPLQKINTYIISDFNKHMTASIDLLKKMQAK
ncbi:muconolactone Delta-isomerase family protein [Chloroflexota bacterium]